MERITLMWGAVMGYALSLLGGGDTLLIGLGTLMVIDYVMGLMLGFMGRSAKTETGKLSSKAAGQGVFKKTAYILCVAVGVVMDCMLGTEFIRNGAVIFFISVEFMSICENLGLMGIEVPPVFSQALELLQKKRDDNEKKDR